MDLYVCSTFRLRYAEFEPGLKWPQLPAKVSVGWVNPKLIGTSRWLQWTSLTSLARSAGSIDSLFVLSEFHLHSPTPHVIRAWWTSPRRV